MISDTDYDKVIQLAKVSAQMRGLGKDKGGHFIMKCPLCTSAIKVDVSEINGHIHGKCGTKTCVHWIE